MWWARHRGAIATADRSSSGVFGEVTLLMLEWFLIIFLGFFGQSCSAIITLMWSIATFSLDCAFVHAYYQWAGKIMFEEQLQAEKEIGFGQLVPLFLLTMPLMVAMEAYQGQSYHSCSSRAPFSLTTRRQQALEM